MGGRGNLGLPPASAAAISLVNQVRRGEPKEERAVSPRAGGVHRGMPAAGSGSRDKTLRSADKHEDQNKQPSLSPGDL